MRDDSIKVDFKGLFRLRCLHCNCPDAEVKTLTSHRLINAKVYWVTFSCPNCGLIQHNEFGWPKIKHEGT